ncbi:39282_t:CDS:2, partial [Gigaspora margarita]
MLKVNNMFESLKAFEVATKLAAKSSGFAFARKDSNLTRRNGKSLFVVLQCTKGSEWHNNWNITEKTRKKKRNTHVIVALYIFELLQRNVTQLRIFSQYCVMNLDQKSLVYQLHISNVLTCVITESVNNISNSRIVLSKDIINERARIKFALNKGPNNNSTQGFLKLLEKRDYMVVPLKTIKKYLIHLFFSHIKAAKCVAKCSEVLVMDSIYKTNIYKYLLVSAIGINNIGNERGSLVSYQITMAWIKNKSKASYTWFLKTLQSKIYDAYSCLLNVFMSDRDQALRNASSKLIFEHIWYAFKKKVEALRFTEFEEEIHSLWMQLRRQLKNLTLLKSEGIYSNVDEGFQYVDLS